MLETNGANGYDILQQMAQSANATFGMTSSSFFFKSRKEPRPLLKNGLSQTDTTITVSNSTESAYSGLLLIDDEVISYTNRNNTQFLGITRAIPPSQPATHNANTIHCNIGEFTELASNRWSIPKTIVLALCVAGCDGGMALVIPCLLYTSPSPRD